MDGSEITVVPQCRDGDLSRAYLLCLRRCTQETRISKFNDNKSLSYVSLSAVAMRRC